MLVAMPKASRASQVAIHGYSSLVGQFEAHED